MNAGLKGANFNSQIKFLGLKTEKSRSVPTVWSL